MNRRTLEILKSERQMVVSLLSKNRPERPHGTLVALTNRLLSLDGQISRLNRCVNA